MKISDLALIAVSAIGGAVAYHIYKNRSNTQEPAHSNKPIILQNDFLTKENYGPGSKAWFDNKASELNKLKSDAASLISQAKALLNKSLDSSLTSEESQKLKDQAAKLQQAAQDKINQSMVIR